MECLIYFKGGIDRLYLIYPWVVSDYHVRSGYLNKVVIPLDIHLMEHHVSRHEVEPDPADVIQRRTCIFKCLLILCNSDGNIDGPGDGVFNVPQASNPVPTLRIPDRM